MHMAKEAVKSKKTRGFRIQQESHEQVVEFARKNCLTHTKAYDVIVSRFFRMNAEDQRKAISQSAG